MLEGRIMNEDQFNPFPSLTQGDDAIVELQRITRLYATLSQCNQAIVRCANETELFPVICRDAVNFGGMKMAWIGMLDASNGRVKPVASFGAGMEYLEGIDISVDAGQPSGCGPTGTSIREDRPFWCQDFQHDSATTVWHERGADFGWGASASLPLHRGGKVAGAFMLYADTPNAFDEAAQRLLEEMAMDISYALDHFDLEAAHKQAELALEQSRKLLTETEQIGKVGGWEFDTDSKKLIWTDEVYRIHELDPGYDLNVEDGVDFYTPASKPVIDQAVQRAIKYGEPFDVELEIITAKGNHRSVHAIGQVDPEHHRVYGFFQDITERKQQEQFDEDQRCILEEIADSAVPLSDVLDAIVRVIQRTRSGVMASVLVISPDGAHLLDGAAPDLPDAYNRAIDGVAIGPCVGSCGTAAFTGERVIVTDIASDPLWADYKELALANGLAACWSEPVINATGDVLGTFAMYYRQPQMPDDRDLELIERAAALTANAITHKQTEQHLNLLASIISETSDFVAMADADGKTLFVNPAGRAMMGFGAHEDLSGLQVSDYHSPEVAGHLMQAVFPVLKKSGIWRGQTEFLCRDGKTVMTDQILLVNRDRQGGFTHYSTIARDINAQIQNEERMRLLENSVASINESVLITDPAGTIVYVNPSFTRNTGYSADDAIGNSPAILNSKQQPKAFYEQFWHTIKDGEAWAGRILNRKKDGTIFPEHLSVAPILKPDGGISHFVAVYEDLSEAESLQQQMMQAQKMEAVGTMAGGIAHDFNNLLAGLTGNTYLMRAHHKEDEEIIRRTLEMESTIMHGAKMIQQMLVFARKDRPEMHDMDLRAFFKEVCKLAEATLPENIVISVDYPHNDQTWIHGDATQLQQVLLNLVVNAHHAVNERDAPRIQLALSHDAPETQLLSLHPETGSDTGWCCLRCTDNGCGIAAGDMKHIFDPFFTTREVGVGTGLGLAMAYGAVQNHRGIIDVQSVEGEGTTFSIYLPMRAAGEAQLVSSRVDVKINGQGRGILIVDDEEGLRKVLAEVLQQNGFTLWKAADGELAIEMYQKYRDQIDLVLMDVVMPNKGGVAAAAEIRAMDADVPIIFQTGYGEETQMEAARSITHSESLQKPVKIDDLLNLIRNRLGC